MKKNILSAIIVALAFLPAQLSAQQSRTQKIINAALKGWNIELRAGYNLGPGCTILGTFGCRGKINPAMLAKRKNAGPDDPHGGPKSMERWKLASTHPDAQDIADAKDLVDRMKHKMAMRERFLAKKAAKLAALRQKRE